jgi:methylated-DNA-[protein]-cysteine S-methyltransferase
MMEQVMRPTMMETEHDWIAEELAELTADPPDRLLDRLVARWVRVPGPVGDLYVASTDRGIAYVRQATATGSEFGEEFRQRFARPLQPASRPPAGLLAALRTGRATGLRFDLGGLTGFEQSVLRAALTIPKGQTRPYSWVAAQIGRPGAVRSVGTALAHNPVPVLIPCHRVIRADGDLGGYVFGAPVKRRLLEGEGANLAEVRELARRGVHYLASDTTGIVCFPGCPNARRISAAHRHGFGSVAEAAAAGYRPCQRCRPGLQPAQ